MTVCYQESFFFGGGSHVRPETPAIDPFPRHTCLSRHPEALSAMESGRDSRDDF